jgi:hypothetical protein
MEFKAAFDAAFCWAGEEVSVVFKCAHCGTPIYFGPRGNEIEVGMLGASPVVDPIPMATYPIAVSSRRDGQMLVVEHAGEARKLPSSHHYISDKYASKS